MSIILKGIDLPEKNKSLYISIFNGKIEIVHMLDAYEVEHTNAQAIQIPKDHGKIVDLDDLVVKYWDGNYMEIDNEAYDNAVAILEAEEK